MNNISPILAQSAGLEGLIFPVLLIIIFWVLLIRPQQKRAKEAKLRQANLKKGDKVVTIGGMHASVNSVSDNTVSLRISEGIYVKYDKTAIAHVVTKDKDKPESAKIESKDEK